MNKKRLIITSLISIFLVVILMLGSTYSIFTTTDTDEELNVYSTGNLDITYTLSSDSISLTESIPISEEEANSIVPYTITVTNNGTVPYMFDLILEDSTSTDVIDYQYIMTKVGKIAAKPLSSCTNNIIKEDIIILAGESVVIDVKVYISDTMKNTEIGKSFFAKLKVDGIAIYNNNTEIDNSILVSTTLSEVAEIGSYIAYTGNNGCPADHCDGTNANYVDETNMGYCSSSSYKFTENGWRVMSKDDGGIYIISAGAPECIRTYALPNLGSSTSTENVTTSLSYITSSNVTYSSSTHNLGTTATYTFPSDINSLNGKYTCGNNTTTSCSRPYLIKTNSTKQTLTLNKFTTTTCTNNNKDCLISKTLSSSSSIYFGSSYKLASNGKFVLSGTKERLLLADIVYSGDAAIKYTCLSTSSTGTCTTLYYITDTGNIQVSGGFYASYKKYTFKENTVYSLATKKYVYGSGYNFDANTGTFTLTGTSSLSWENNYSTIIDNKKYTCFSTSKNCDILYTITNTSTSSKMIYRTSEAASYADTPSAHISRLDSIARTYCNSKYAKDSVCNETTARAMREEDYTKIVGSDLNTCYEVSSETCGLNNTLINNGSYYWYATQYSSIETFYWRPVYSYLDSSGALGIYGVRPVLYLKSDIRIVGGSGTADDPYQLA